MSSIRITFEINYQIDLIDYLRLTMEAMEIIV